MGKGVSSFLNGGYRGGNFGPIYPSGSVNTKGGPSAPPKKISPNAIPKENIGKVAGKSGGFVVPTKTEQKLDSPQLVKALGLVVKSFK